MKRTPRRWTKHATASPGQSNSAAAFRSEMRLVTTLTHPLDAAVLPLWHYSEIFGTWGHEGCQYQYNLAYGSGACDTNAFLKAWQAALSPRYAVSGATPSWDWPVPLALQQSREKVAWPAVPWAGLAAHDPGWDWRALRISRNKQLFNKYLFTWSVL